MARILSDQIRSEDFLALERSGEGRDLHARFGGDEFCFLIPDFPGCDEAFEIADRFKGAVEASRLVPRDRRLSARPVRVDVGVVCLQPGSHRRAPRRRAEARGGADPPGRYADVWRQGPARVARLRDGGAD